MPIYEYQCESCEKLTEAIQRLDEEPLVICPHCGGPLRKLMSAPSFQFKGTGWYVTDYAGKSGGDHGGEEGAKKAGQSSSPSGDDKASKGAGADAKPGGGTSAEGKTSSSTSAS